MPTIKIKVQDKIATNLTPNQKIVCGNEDYKVEFEFDSQWNNAEAKTALLIYNGGAIVEPFLGNVCKVPILQNTELLTVGVKTDDGLLYTSTGAKVFCLPSASDLANIEIPAPSKDVYDEIIGLINSKIIETNKPYDGLPLMDGISQAGESNNFARGDHRHPTDENLKSIAQNAQNLATTAQESADLSVEKAESALQSAGLANETANSAKELSQTANENAKQALNTANNIDEIASSALNVANSAFERAIEVSETASQAQTVAESAKETAKNASAQVGTANANSTLALNAANDAKTLGENAKQKANTALEQSNELKLQIPYFGTTLEMVLDQSSYVLTAKLFNKDGTVLSMQTVDLPLETMVVSGRYDYITKQIILTLKNGETISFPVVDLVDGIVSQDTFTAELSKKVDKISIANQLLGTDGSGNPTSYPLDSVGTKVLVDGLKVTEFNADEKANIADLSKVAISGSFNDLDDKPDISAELTDYVKTTDWATSTTAGVVIVPAVHQNKGIVRENTTPTLEILPTTNALMDESKGLNPVVPKNIDYAVNVALADCKDTSLRTDDSAGENGEVVKGTKTKALELLGALPKYFADTRKSSGIPRVYTNIYKNGDWGSGEVYVDHWNTATTSAIPTRGKYNTNIRLPDLPTDDYESVNKKYVDNLPDYLTLTDEQKAKWRALFGITASGGGSGEDGVSITKAEINASGELVLSFSDGNSTNVGKVVGVDGEDGNDGVSITKIEQTKTSTVSGGENEITITLSNGETSTFKVYNGEKGESGTGGSGGGMTETELGAYLYNNQFYPLPSTEANNWLKSRFGLGEITADDIFGADKITPISQIYATKDELNALSTSKLYRVKGTVIENYGDTPTEFLFEATVRNNDESLYTDQQLVSLWETNIGLLSFRIMYKEGQSIAPWNTTFDQETGLFYIYGMYLEGFTFYKSSADLYMTNISIEEI